MKIPACIAYNDQRDDIKIADSLNLIIFSNFIKRRNKP